MTDFILVLTATSSKDEAQIIADAAVNNQLAAAVQIVGPVISTFQWKSRREHAEEWLCLLKTRKDLYEELESVIRTHHSYELPGILAIPVVAGSQTYVEWLQENLKEKRKTVKEQLLQTLNEAHKQLIAAAVDAHKRVNVREGEWGPREVLAHIMGWEAEAAARIPLLVAGHLPVKYSDETFNAAIITAIGNQPFDEICNLLRQAHQRLIGVLTTLDDDIFVPGNPVHTRVEAIIHHNLEHAHALGYMK